MAKKKIKIQLDEPAKDTLEDKKASIVNGTWLKIWGWDQYSSEHDTEPSYVRISGIQLLASMGSRSEGTRVDCSVGESCLYVRETPEEILRIIADHEFNAALESTLGQKT